MVYNFEKIREASNAARAGRFESGPWTPPNGWWTIPSWRVWRKFSTITLEIHEHLVESETNASPDHPGDPFDVTEVVTERWYDFEAEVHIDDMWRGAASENITGMPMWWHDSKTPWGEGLYMAEGQIIVKGTSVTRTKVTEFFTPADGPPSTFVRSDVTTTDENASVNISYVSDHEAINGLSTKCRMVVQQALHGSGGYDASHLYPDREQDPDGNEWDPDDPDVPAVEVYFTDTALANLAAGSWSADMVLTGSSVSESGGALYYWEKHYNRTGSLSMAVA